MSVDPLVLSIHRTPGATDSERPSTMRQSDHTTTDDVASKRMMDSHDNSLQNSTVRGAQSRQTSVLQTRIAELELRVAERDEQLRTLRYTNETLSDQVVQLRSALGLHPGNGALAAMEGMNVSFSGMGIASSTGTLSKDDMYVVQKQLLATESEKKKLKAQLSRAESNIEKLQTNLTAEMEKSKDEADRQSIFLRSQLIEQKELNTTLQERLIANATLSRAVQLSSSDTQGSVTESCEERILIVSDSVVRRLKSALADPVGKENTGSSTGKRSVQQNSHIEQTELNDSTKSFFGKQKKSGSIESFSIPKAAAAYNVDVHLSGRILVFRGQRVNVQLLKADTLSYIHEYYSALLENQKENDGIDDENDDINENKSDRVAKNENGVSAIQDWDRMSRTISTHEDTIESLHVALRHAQQRTEEAGNNMVNYRSRIAQLEEEARLHGHEETKQKLLWDRERMKLESTIRDIGNSNDTALETIRRDKDAAARHRSELLELAREVEIAKQERQTVERELYLCRDQLNSTKRLHTDAQGLMEEKNELQSRVDDLHRTVTSLNDLITEKESSFLTTVQEQQRQIGRLEEQGSSTSQKLQRTEELLVEAVEARETLQAQLANAKGVINDLRGFNYGTVNQHQDDMSVEPSTLKVSSDDNEHASPQKSALEIENEQLRKELLAAFDDMKRIGVNLRDNRLKRDEVSEKMNRLERGNAQLGLDVQRAECVLVDERMKYQAKLYDMDLEIVTLRQEVQHQKDRNQMLHQEYQRQIKQYVRKTSDGVSTCDQNSSRYPSRTSSIHSATALQEVAAAAVAEGQCNEREFSPDTSLYAQPNDASRVPQCTPPPKIHQKPSAEGSREASAAKKVSVYRELRSSPRSVPRARDQQLPVGDTESFIEPSSSISSVTMTDDNQHPALTGLSSPGE